MKEGQCFGRKGPGKGRSPAAARAPLSGPEREERRLHPPSAHGTSGDYTARHPGPSAVSRVRHLLPQRSLPGPMRTPACTGKRPVSRGEAHSAYNSGGDEAPFTSGVPHHTPPDLAVFNAPPLSHTHSRREPGEGRQLRDGEMLIIRERQPTRRNIYIYNIICVVCVCLSFLSTKLCNLKSFECTFQSHYHHTTVGQKKTHLMSS